MNIFISIAKFSYLYLAFLVVLFSSCQSNNRQNRSDILSLLQKYDFNIVLSKLEENEELNEDPVTTFFASVAAYFNGDYEAFSQYRIKAFSLNKSEMENYFNNYIDSSDLSNPINSFIVGIYSIIQGDTIAGLNYLNTAKELFTDSTLIELVDYNIIILTDTSDYMLQNIFYIKYSGNVKILNKQGIWGPFDSTFQINKAHITSMVGRKYNFSATVDGWGYVLVPETDSILTYFYKAVEGELVVFNQNNWLGNKDSKTVIVDAHCNYDEKPLDYFGKCKFVSMKKKKQFYALLNVPSFEYSNGDISSAMTLCDSREFSLEYFKLKGGGVSYFGNLVRIIDDGKTYGRIVD